MKTTVNVNFTKNNTNKKDEVVLEFQVRGELSDEQVVKLARLKSAGAVVVDIRTSQTDIDDYYHETPREGIRGTVNPDGTINVGDGQVTIEEVGEQPATDEETTEPSDQEQETDEETDQEPDEESELPVDGEEQEVSEAEEVDEEQEESEEDQQPAEDSDDLED
jgi:hypothetical protein